MQGVHGEYKVPGGKLVVADFDVSEGRLRDVRISGDFFLEPDDALEVMDRALEGAAADLSARRFAELVQNALPDGVQMYGVSPQAVGVAVRRALGAATDWGDYDWRLIHDEPQSPAMHMALDEVLAGEVAAGRRPPTLRIWEWASPAVVIGSFQSLRNEVDPEGASRHGIEVVRRISGGGAMFIEPGNTITYSLYVPDSLVAGMSFAESYAYLDDWVLVALGDLGVKAWYQPLNDITSDAGKIGGAAQKRLASGAVLHHVTMAYDMNPAKMLEVLRIGREKLSDKGSVSANKRVTPLSQQTQLPRQDIVDSLVATFEDRYGLTSSSLTQQEQAAAEKLRRDKFESKEWLYLLP